MLEQSTEKIIEEKGEIVACTSGVSMYPMLRHRKDMVVIEKVCRPLKRHDVPLYRAKGGKLTLHRILKVTPNGYIVRGDNLFRKETDITDNNIIGVLRAFYRNGKMYDCEKSIKYKMYVVLMRLSYPIRFLWARVIRPILVKIKHFIFK